HVTHLIGSLCRSSRGQCQDPPSSEEERLRAFNFLMNALDNRNFMTFGTRPPPSRRISWLIIGLGACLVAGSAGRAGAATPVVTRGPYLQQNTSTNVILRWRTDTTN